MLEKIPIQTRKDGLRIITHAVAQFLRLHFDHDIAKYTVYVSRQQPDETLVNFVASGERGELLGTYNLQSHAVVISDINISKSVQASDIDPKTELISRAIANLERCVGVVESGVYVFRVPNHETLKLQNFGAITPSYNNFIIARLRLSPQQAQQLAIAT